MAHKILSHGKIGGNVLGKIKAKHIICMEILLLAVLVCFGAVRYRGGHLRAVLGDTAAADDGDGSGEKEDVSEDEDMEHSDGDKDYIKYVEFNVTAAAMDKALAYDTETYGSENHLDWVDLLAYLGARYGGDFSRYKASDLDDIAERLSDGESLDSITADMEYFPYYREAYGAVLGGMAGEYRAETVDEDTGKRTWEEKYGLKAYHPIAKGFPYSEFDDFGVSRSYGYRRNHLGHDLMGQTGTPVICVESGYVEAMGWNQYGGWRLGIRSFDGKRYYYYAHLRQNFPYCKSLKEGDVVTAGDVIGYMGRTGYSTKENTNNIDTPHLHFGLQLIFDESQKEGVNEIWVSCYELSRFLYQHRSETVRDDATKEWSRVADIEDPAVTEFEQSLK